MTILMPSLVNPPDTIKKEPIPLTTVERARKCFHVVLSEGTLVYWIFFCRTTCLESARKEGSLWAKFRMWWSCAYTVRLSPLIITIWLTTFRNILLLVYCGTSEWKSLYWTNTLHQKWIALHLIQISAEQQCASTTLTHPYESHGQTTQFWRAITILEIVLRDLFSGQTKAEPHYRSLSSLVASTSSLTYTRGLSNDERPKRYEVETYAWVISDRSTLDLVDNANWHQWFGSARES